MTRQAVMGLPAAANPSFLGKDSTGVVFGAFSRKSASVFELPLPSRERSLAVLGMSRLHT